MTELLRTVLWRELEEQGPGTHWCELAQNGDGWQIEGVVLTAEAGMPIQARYRIDVDEGWATRAAEITVLRGNGDERRLHVHVAAEQRWQIEREPVAEIGVVSEDTAALDGHYDIDLSLAPATNTLPIRRLAPAIGETVDVTAVWIGFPELVVELLPQRYTRLDERRYRYESNDGAFVREIEVDDLGLVVSYEGLWQRIATSR
jgi:uncharacterized protein